MRQSVTLMDFTLTVNDIFLSELGEHFVNKDGVFSSFQFLQFRFSKSKCAKSIDCCQIYVTSRRIFILVDEVGALARLHKVDMEVQRLLGIFFDCHQRVGFGIRHGRVLVLDE